MYNTPKLKMQVHVDEHAQVSKVGIRGSTTQQRRNIINKISKIIFSVFKEFYFFVYLWYF